VVEVAGERLKGLGVERFKGLGVERFRGLGVEEVEEVEEMIQ
jgi:hypothetical protein